MAILSIETSSKVCSIAIHEAGELLGLQTLFTEKSSSGLLTPIIRQLLDNCNLKVSDLQAIAVSKGPGSYTGLRIEVSTAKGLCTALDLPLIAVDTLKAMAFQVSNILDKKLLICPLIDARRMEVYCSVFTNNLECVEEVSAKIIEHNSFAELLSNNSVVFIGDGATKCKDILSQNTNALFLDENILPSATTIGKLAYDQYLKNDFENLVTFEPFYLKDFIGTVPR